MDLWQPIALSLRIALTATLVTAAIAVPLAFVLARRRIAGRSVVEAAILLPLVLPPTVVGYVLLVVLGRRSVVGEWLAERFDYTFAFSVESAVLAAAIVAFPLLYLSAKSAFASIDREYEDVARVMGARVPQVFWCVSLPMARRGVVSGLLLAFARALGEFGATVMVFGWQPDNVTLPIAVYRAYEENKMDDAAGPVIVLAAISILLIAAYNKSAALRPE